MGGGDQVSDLDAYCPGCGYICNERVTHSETCDECHKPVEWHTSDQQDRIAELEEEVSQLRYKVVEHENRWNWLTRSIEAISGEGFFSWASPVLAVIKKCRYEKLEVTK